MRMWLPKFAFAVTGIVLCLSAICTHAQQTSAIAAIPAYQPQPVEGGVIRSWGHVFLKKIMASWESKCCRCSFHSIEPRITCCEK